MYILTTYKRLQILVIYVYLVLENNKIKMIKKLSIILPVYNEARTVHLILDKIKSVQLVQNIEKEIIIIINDCSTDNTKLHLSTQ